MLTSVDISDILGQNCNFFTFCWWLPLTFERFKIRTYCSFKNLCLFDSILDLRASVDLDLEPLLWLEEFCDTDLLTLHEHDWIFFHFWVNLSFNVSLWVCPFNVCSTCLTLALRHQLDARICTLFNMTRPYEHCCVHILWAVTVALVQYPHLTAFYTVRVRKRRREVLEPHKPEKPSLFSSQNYFT